MKAAVEVCSDCEQKFDVPVSHDACHSISRATKLSPSPTLMSQARAHWTAVVRSRRPAVMLPTLFFPYLDCFGRGKRANHRAAHSQAGLRRSLAWQLQGWLTPGASGNPAEPPALEVHMLYPAERFMVGRETQRVLFLANRRTFPNPIKTIVHLVWRASCCDKRRQNSHVGVCVNGPCLGARAHAQANQLKQCRCSLDGNPTDTYGLLDGLSRAQAG